MHVFFSGIGGTGIGPLALIAKRAGYEVSGSDLRESQYIKYLRAQGIEDIHIGQSREQIATAHAKKPIDWFVYSSALPLSSPNHPELVFCREQGIKTSKRDELLNEVLAKKDLKLIAVAGTHGKTTTTAMTIWLFKQLGEPVSYSIGAKISFGEMGEFNASSEYFVYECDEFDRNFLAFHPYLSVITGLAWDHHEVFPTQDDYFSAFRRFLNQSSRKILWQEDVQKLEFQPDQSCSIQNYTNSDIGDIGMAGLYNRRDGWLAAQAVHQLTEQPLDKLLNSLSNFPGISRRFEKITENLYSDYAHTPDKIIGCMNVAKEIAAKTGQKIAIIYEPLTNRRMRYTAADHQDVFEDASNIYWIPSYMAREDPSQPVLSPAELIKNLSPRLQQIAQPMEMDEELKAAINQHLQAGDMIVAMSGGGGGSLDEWLRQNFSAKPS